MSEKDGGPAFPSFQRERVYDGGSDRLGRDEFLALGGMSLRDYFAGQALAGLCANGTAIYISEHKFAIERATYILADAMLEARKK